MSKFLVVYTTKSTESLKVEADNHAKASDLVVEKLQATYPELTIAIDRVTRIEEPAS